MSKYAWIVAAVGVGIGIAGCTQENPNVERKIDALAAKVTALDQKLTSIAAARGAAPQQQQRPKRIEPDNASVFAVPISGLPVRGKADALVTIVEGYEYACPACSSARQTVASTLAKYGDKVRFVYKPYIVHPDIATDASLAACAAHQQGKFDTMDALLWDKAFAKRDFTAKNIETIAAEAGLDMSRYGKDIEACRAEIKQHESELRGFGQGATPTFFVNGRYTVGANPDKLHALVDQEIALAEKRIAEGTRRADYYKRWVLDKGLKKFEPKLPGS